MTRILQLSNSTSTVDFTTASVWTPHSIEGISSPPPRRVFADFAEDHSQRLVSEFYNDRTVGLVATVTGSSGDNLEQEKHRVEWLLWEAEIGRAHV